jgi:hypothetical protein
LGSARDEGVADADCAHDEGPLSLTGGVIIPRKPDPCASPSQFMLRGFVRPLRTTIWLCSEASFPSVKDESRGDAFQPKLPVPPVGHHRPLPSDDEPHGR